MNDRTEARIRRDLAAVDAARLASPDDIGAAMVAVERRTARRRRSAVGTAAALLVVGASAVLWNTAGGPERATTGDGGAPPTTLTATPTSRVPLTTPPAPVSADGWTEVPRDPRGAVTGMSVAWTGAEALAVGGVLQNGDAVDGVMAFDPATSSWRSVSEQPVPLLWPIVQWTGDRLIAIGWDPDRLNTAAASLDLATGEWTVGPEMPFGFKTIPDNPHTWTGGALLVLAGATPVAYDPNADSWRTLAAWPLAERLEATSVWTGSEWIVWGGAANDMSVSGPLGDGAAYDPTTDSWRLLAESPLAPRIVGGVWTGSEVLIFAGRSGDGNGMFAFGDGAAYDPVADSWRAIGDGPAHPGFEAAWADGRLYVFAKGGMSSYDAAHDVWDTPFQGAGTCFDAASPVWTGTSLLLLGCYSGASGGALFTPAS